MVFHESSDRSLPIGFAGSSTLVRYKSINYIVLTRHQIGLRAGEDPKTDILETLRISSGLGILKNIPLKICIHEMNHADEEFHDILLFHATDDWETKASDQPYFVSLKNFSREKRRKSFLAGYPLITGSMDDYIDQFYAGSIGKIDIKRAISDCDIDLEYKSNASHFRRYLHSKPKQNVDGYSGGAIFSLIGDLENFEIVLDGIVLRSGTHHVHIVDVDYLITMIEKSYTNQ